MSVSDEAIAGQGTIVIVGGGQAGLQAAASLRSRSYPGNILIIGDEAELPYQRPPLSKAYLREGAARASLDLRSPNYFADSSIELLTGHRIAAIDRVRRTIRSVDGAEFAYDHLILATGARNRELGIPGARLKGVHQLRSAKDAEDIRRSLAGAEKLVIIGAGFIGLEVAAFAASANKDVTVLEASTRPMSRQLSSTMSDFFARTHEQSGIQFRFETVASHINGRNGSVESVETSNGTIVPADFVLIGIGVIPNVGLAEQCGLRIDNGIVVDEHLVTSDPSISAIGDCASFRQPYGNGIFGRLESVQNAVGHAHCVAARLTGAPKPYRALPWFWSDQGALKLQIAGSPRPDDESVTRGTPTPAGFSVFCFRDGALVGVESANKAADHMMARRILTEKIPLTMDEAADATFDLKARASKSRV